MFNFFTHSVYRIITRSRNAQVRHKVTDATPWTSSFDFANDQFKYCLLYYTSFLNHNYYLQVTNVSSKYISINACKKLTDYLWMVRCMSKSRS